jgi:hypothetical protein
MTEYCKSQRGIWSSDDRQTKKAGTTVTWYQVSRKGPFSPTEIRQCVAMYRVDAAERNPPIVFKQ